MSVVYIVELFPNFVEMISVLRVLYRFMYFTLTYIFQLMNVVNVSIRMFTYMRVYAYDDTQNVWAKRSLSFGVLLGWHSDEGG